jgi:hypothetical protein
MGAAEPVGFRYPFIDAEERDPGPLLAELAGSARAKAAESAALQQATLAATADLVAACAAAMADRFAAGGRLYAFGNRGSSTDCATFAALFASQSVHRIQESQTILGYHLWAAAQQAMHKTVDRCVHPDVRNGPSSGPNPNGGTE